MSLRGQGRYKRLWGSRRADCPTRVCELSMRRLIRFRPNQLQNPGRIAIDLAYLVAISFLLHLGRCATGNDNFQTLPLYFKH